MRIEPSDWRPTARLDVLRKRAQIVATVRAFFAARGILEVETPALCGATVTDPHLASLSCVFRGPGAPAGRRLYLQTSPEYAMKRLLAAGIGSIYQICKAFRDGESGRYHNPEFTLLEWYRPGLDHHGLMGEVDELLHEVLGTLPAERLTYAEAFERHVALDPHRAPVERLKLRADEMGLEAVRDLQAGDRNDWLHLLLIHCIEPHLGRGRPCFLFDFPASQAALARVRPGDPPVAERFELYVDGVELANGFHELTEVSEQRRRFEMDLESRRIRGLEAVPIDERFLACLASGMPSAAGVALGVDRLVLIATGARSLADVVAFPVDRA